MVVASWTCGCGYNGLREHSNLGQLETECETVLSMGSWEAYTKQEGMRQREVYIIVLARQRERVKDKVTNSPRLRRSEIE